MSNSGRSVRTNRTPTPNRLREVERQRDRRHRDSDRQRDRHRQERRDKRPSSSNGSYRPSSSQSVPRSHHSRPPTSRSEPQSRHYLPASQYHGSPPQSVYLEKQSCSEKCSNMCSKRGILQFVEVAVGLLVLICVVASYAVITGYTSSAGMGIGSFNIDSAYSPFEGAELQQVRDLDMQYSHLRAPAVYGGVAFTLGVGAATLFFLLTGAKPLHRISTRVLVAELVFDALACIGYIVAVGLYLHFIKQVNATDVCKKRERLYAGRGYNWMNCEVQGGDGAVALFALIEACLYLPSAVLCGLIIKKRRQSQGNRTPKDHLSGSPREKDHKVYHHHHADTEQGSQSLFV
ncbi:MARVEL domain-containing protein 3-like [Rhinatrema bivittatum]|uniref:MARVEL domain-containing protein 3-like n=1 Tax=Rhinatrema bivittatum TaxID=194408 RepID=UPI00112895CB|nr:MARVEL domain-containing protein 3-like [Rhinatrema bivittatum]XP_029446162.1 MARVEL domain-containing protein 3-like [Rhinatrema bivittatum]XP_029446163.1 MARVEL domain-containing protein 3-like [Rhinatrema bivittatum]XP_029446164.1 MARVEL domain-containing protein 3-like [Rhinatrema bivittatum]